MPTNPTKAIRIQARQTLTNYCKPNSYIIRETYPLPPYSTVIGMIHAICGFTSYHPMKVSVQGSFGSTTSDLYQRYTFGNMKYDPTRHTFSVPSKEGKEVGITRGLGYTETIGEVDLLLHIVPESEEDFELILAGLENPKVFPALGRHDDLLDIYAFEVVELKFAEKKVRLLTNAYVPIDYLSEIVPLGQDPRVKVPGTVYRLRKSFTINEKTNCREWTETIRAKHVGAKLNYYYRKPLVDTDQNLVFLA